MRRAISPLDRGFLFADSVYEVLPVFAGRMFRFREHSIGSLAASPRFASAVAAHACANGTTFLNELIRRNGGGDMYLYAQVTRGMEYGRNHAFPLTVSRPYSPWHRRCRRSPESSRNGLVCDHGGGFRWGRCDIKATMLLANVLMKQRAAEAGAQEAIIVRDGEVLEGSSTSVFIVIEEALI